MEISVSERRIPLYKLLEYKTILKQLLSFSAHIDRCNFTFRVGWSSNKQYVNDQGHGLEEYKPDIRGIDVLDIYYIKLTDTVVLTEDQYRDYRTILGIVE